MKMKNHVVTIIITGQTVLSASCSFAVRENMSWADMTCFDHISTIKDHISTLHLELLVYTSETAICNSISSKKAMTAFSQAGSPLFLMLAQLS